jgi:hypothetical protein
MLFPFDPMTYKRECGGCTACCEGWMHGQSHGEYFQPGRPCHFKCETGCAIYENRPEKPCKTFSCEWLQNYEIPEWMKPNLSGVIITSRDYGENKKYLEVLEMGKKIDAEVLNWIFLHHYTTDIPIRVQVNRGWYNFGPKDFLSEMSGIKASRE